MLITILPRLALHSLSPILFFFSLSFILLLSFPRARDCVTVILRSVHATSPDAADCHILPDIKRLTFIVLTFS